MKNIVSSCLLGILFYTPEALADIAPDKTGCSTMGGLEMGLVLLPLVVLGALIFFRREETENK